MNRVAVLLTQESTPLEQLDPPTRAIVLMALLGLVLLGMLLIVCVMIGARWMRRLARQRVAPREWPSGWKASGRIAGDLENMAEAPRSLPGEEVAPLHGETLTGSESTDDTVVH